MAFSVQIIPEGAATYTVNERREEHSWGYQIYYDFSITPREGYIGRLADMWEVTYDNFIGGESYESTEILPRTNSLTLSDGKINDDLKTLKAVRLRFVRNLEGILRRGGTILRKNGMILRGNAIAPAK